MPRDIEALQLQMSADIRKFEKQMQRMTEVTEKRLREVEQRANRGASNINRSLAQANAAKSLGFDAARASAGRSLSGIEGDVRRSSSAIRESLGGVATALATVFAADSIANYADGYTRFTNSLKVAGLEGHRLIGTQEQLFATAQKYGVQLESLGALYGRTSQGAKELGASQADLQRFTEGVAAALKVQGGSEESSRGAILQLTQALGGAIVRAEEFNSINEGARPILQAVADNVDRFGGSVAKLRGEVIEGKVTSREFFQAFLQGADGLEKQATKSSFTIAASFQILNNAIGKYIGETDQGLSATQRFSQGVIALSQNLDTIAPAIAVIAAVLAGRMVSALAMSLAGTIANSLAQAKATMQANVYSAALAENVGMLNAHATASGRAAAATLGVGGAARAAGGALLGAFGGPVGLAITAVLIAITGVAVASAQASARAAELEQQTKSLKERLNESERAANAASAQIKGLEKPIDQAAIKAAALTGEQKKLADETYRVAAAIKAEREQMALKDKEAAVKLANERGKDAERAEITTRRGMMMSNYGGGTIGGSVPIVTGREIAQGKKAAALTPEAKAYKDALNDVARADAVVKQIQQTPLAGFIQQPNATVDPKAAKAAAAAAAKAQREAEKAAKDALRDDRRLEDQLYAAGDALLQAQRQRAMTAREAMNLELQAIARDEDAARIDRDREFADKNITAAERDQLAEAEKAVFTERRANAQREGEANIRAERMQAEEQYLDLTLELLHLQSDAARTAKERRRLELQILEATQQRARDELEERIRVDGARTGGPTFDHGQARDALGRVQKAQTDAVIRDTQGPMERWKDQANQTAEEISESYERVKVDALDGLTDGLLDVITGTKDAGEAFRDMANSIIADLARIAIQRYITAPLANVLFPGGAASSGSKSGGGDWLGGLLKAGLSLFGGGRASGGPVQAGKAYTVGERGMETFVPWTNGTVVSNRQMQAIAAARTGRAAAQQVMVDVGVTVDDEGKIQAYVRNSSVMAMQGGATIARIDRARTVRRTMY